MDRVIIDNQKDRLCCPCNKSSEKCAKNWRVHILFKDNKAHGTPLTDGRNQIYSVPGSSGQYHRWLPTRRAGCSRVTIRSNRRFITKENLHFLFTVEFFDGRKILCHPLNNQKLILLKGLTLRTLCAQAKFLKLSIDRNFSQLNTELPNYQLANHATSPQCKFKLHLSWNNPGNQCENLLQLITCQFWCLASLCVCEERLHHLIDTLQTFHRFEDG